MFRTALSVAFVLALIAAPQAAAPQQSPPQSKSGARSSAKGRTGAIVNINTATAAELEGLPGIGAKTAARIVEYRQKNGPFKKIEELMNVRGVGEKNFVKLKAQITVAAAKVDQAQRL